MFLIEVPSFGRGWRRRGGEFFFLFRGGGGVAVHWEEEGSVWLLSLQPGEAVVEWVFRRTIPVWAVAVAPSSVGRMRPFRTGAGGPGKLSSSYKRFWLRRPGLPIPQTQIAKSVFRTFAPEKMGYETFASVAYIDRVRDREAGR